MAETRKSSKAITLTALGVVSVLVVGYCSAQNDDYEEVGADCVDLDTRLPDGSYQVVDDDYCDEARGSHHAYGWYYGGVRTGARVLQGSTVRPAEARITSRNGHVIQKGGFGGRGGGGS
ncbi:hypothetical protein [Nonomuraea dietziae]|jgi:hypothetical protein|uniref:Uncharacterized protein n=1 Tax=Nonomuraea dietziae TaxID=65515 RepID=A0A7W5UYC8_9ACTN|nr:hypothetical protein [Nonomuraea dietziae]MBB3726942.1 hypothetical protein [Nonomuraea dietziae]